MKICMLSKYPPIEGGVSSRTYWLARALGEKGHEVHIVTNAQEVEEEYREQIEDVDSKLYAPKNVYVHSTGDTDIPWHIPFSKAYGERLASLAIDVIERYDLQLIDSLYVLPYAISGFLAKTVTGKPQIIRHAGSDINKLMPYPELNILFKSVFKKVDKIVTYPAIKDYFIKQGIDEDKIYIDEKISVDTGSFNPYVKPFDLSKYIKKEAEDWPVITYIGKINYFWESKGIGELVEAAKDLGEDFLLLFVANGKGLTKFQAKIKEKNLEDRVIFLNFVPPWKIPSIIKRSACIIVLERDFPIADHTPTIPKEVMATGKCLLLSTELYEKGVYEGLEDGRNVVVVNPKDIKQLRKAFKKVIKNPDDAERIGSDAHKIAEKVENFDEYIKGTIKLYEEILSKS